MEEKSPLETLVADSSAVDEQRLTDILYGRVNLDPGAGDIRFLPGVQDSLTIREGVVVTLLAQQGLHQLNPEVPAGLTPKALSDRIGAKGASVRPMLKELREGGVLVKNEDGEYVVPAYSLGEAEAMLGEDDE